MKTLVVEDEPISRELLMDVMANYGVTHGATNGVEALAKFQETLLQQEPYDLICLDIMMPGLDGQETLIKIRKIEADRGISVANRVKVVMVTALSDNRNVVEAYENGSCQAYLTKPFSSDKLRDKLYELDLMDQSG